MLVHDVIAAMTRLPLFDYLSYDIRFLTPERKAELIAAAAADDAYLVGGFSATLAGTGGMKTTAFDHPSAESSERTDADP